VLKHLYKHTAKAYKLDKSNSAFVLTLNVLAPTLEEVAAVQAEVEDNALTKAIEAVRSTVRMSSRI
jgi:hypothetical protein